MPREEWCGDAYLVLGGTSEKMRKRRLHVLGEAWCEYVLFRAELVPRLTHDRVYDIDPGNFVLGLALLDELFHALHHMLVELDGLHGGAGNRGHFRLGYGWLVLVQARELEEGFSI